MDSAALSIEIAGEELELDAQRALYWKRRKALLLADPHFGKAAAFHAAGIPVPPQTMEEDLRRLDALLFRTRARRLIVLGDFLHALLGRDEYTLALLERWRKTHRTLKVVLVRGNHDLKAGDPPGSLGIECVDEPYALSPFELCHDPAKAGGAGGAYALAGHLHPAIRLAEAKGASWRLPCFHFSRRAGILPAFGGFTGVQTIRPEPGDGIYAIAGEALFEIRKPRRPAMPDRAL